MIFNYDKETGSLNNGENISNLKQEIVDFFTKKQDIVKPYSLTKGDNDFFAAYKTKITPDEINSNSENAIELTKKLANQYSDCAGAIEKIIEEEGLLGVTESNLAKAQSTTIQGVTKFRAALTSVGSVIKSVGASMLNMGIAMVASWAVGKIIEGLIDLAHYDENIIKVGQEAKESIDNTFNSFEEGQQKVTDLATKFADSTDQIKTTGDAIDQVAEKYTELHKGVVGSTNENRSLSSEDYQSYLDICNQLAAQFPQLVSGYDAQGNALLNLGSNADSAADSIRNLYNAQMLSANVEIGENLQDTYKGTITQVEQYNGQISDLKEENEKLQAEMNEYTGTNNGKSIFTFGSKKLNVDNRKLTGEQIKAINNALHEFAGDEYSMQGLSDGTTVVDGLEDLSKEKIQQLNNAFSEAMNVSYDTEIKGLQAQINANKSKSSSIDLLIKDQWNSMANSLSNYLQTSEAFSGLDSSLQNAFLGHLTDIDLTSLSEDYDGLVLPFLYGEFIEPMNSLEPEAQESLSKLLTLDTSKLKQKEYYDQVHSVIEGLFPDDIDLQRQWLKTLGLSDAITAASTEMGKIKTAFKGKAFENWINDLSIDDISIGAQLLDDGFNVESGLIGWNKFLEAIENTKKAAAEAKSDTTLASILSDNSDEGLSKTVDTFQSDISSIEETLQSLKTGDFKESDLTDLMQQFPQLIGTTDDLQTALNKIKLDKAKALFKNIDDGLENATDKELQNAKAFKQNLLKSVDFTDMEVSDIQEALIEPFSQIVGSASDSLLYSQINGFLSKYATMLSTGTGRDAFYKAMLVDPELFKKNQEEVTQAWKDNLPTAKDIIQDTDIQSQLTDYQDKYQSLYQAQKDLKNGLMTGSTKKTFLDKFPDLAKYAGNTETLSSAIDDLMDSMDSDVTNQFTDAIKTLQDAGQYADASALQSYVEAVLDGAHDIEGAYQKIAGLKIPTPQYAELKEALESSNEGDLYNELLSQYKTAKEAWKKGEVGTDDFKSFASIISPTGVSDAVNFGENQAMFERYFQDTSTGVENFLEDLQKLDLASNESGHWTSTLGNNLDEMRDAAQRLNMGFEPFMMMFGRLEDYGATTDFFSTEEEGQQHLSDLYEQIAEKKQKLAEIKADPELAGDQSAINALNQDLEELYARVQNTQTGLEEYPEKAAYYEKKNLEQAKDVVTQMNADIQEATEQGNEELAKTIEKARDNYLKENGYVLQPEVQGPQKQGSIENPAAREFTNPKEFGNYESVIQKIQNATEEQKSSMQESIATLSQYSESELGNIDLFDEQYTPGLENAEQALDSLVSTFGLTKEEALQLVVVLSDMGQIKTTPEVDLTTVQDQIDQAKESLEGKEINVDLNINISEASEEELRNKSAEIEHELNTNSSLSASDRTTLQDTKNAIDNQVVTLTVQEKVEKGADVDDLLNMDDKKLETVLDVHGTENLQNAREQLEYIKQNREAEVDMTVKLDETQFNKLLGDNSNEQASINVTANNDEAKAKIDESKNYAEKSKGTMKIDGNNDAAINKGTSAVQMINGMTGIVKVDADISNMASAINNELNKAHTINISANVTAHVSGSASGGAPKGASTVATGTALRIAHADGTAYNVLNYTPAHADGNISLNNNETALVNELGNESVVRDGKWMLLPGGAHFENLKKGDIVFNAQQTSELINSGRVTSGSGHARAYASGTLGSGISAFAGGTHLLNWDKTRTQVGKQSSSSADDKNTKAKNANTKSTNDNTKAAKKSKKTWDWVEIRIKWWGKQVKKISDKITDYIDKSTKQSLLKQQMSKMNYEIGSNEKGATAYMKKAKKVAKKYTYYNSDGKAIKTKVPKKYQKLVQKGAYRIEDMNTSTDKGKALAEAIEQYQTWYNKAQDCKQAVVDLKKEQMELFEQWANMPTEKAEKSIERLTAGFAGLNATQSRLSAAQTGGSTQAAMIKATKDTATQAKATVKQSKKAVTTATDANKKAQSKKKDANNELTKKKSKLLSTKGLSNAQKTAISKNQKIDTSKLKGTKKRRADAYNKALTNKKNADKAASTAKSNLNSAKSKYNTDQKIAEYLSGNVSEADAGYSSSDELSYMNTLVDKNVDNLKQVAKDRDEAYKESARNSKVYEAKYSTAVSTRDQYQKDKASGKKLASQYSKQLTKSQRNALKAGKTVSLKGIKDKDLLKQLKTYNTAVKNLPSAITAADDAQQQYNITLDAEKTAAENAAQAEIEAAQAVVQAVQDKFDNTKSYYEKQLSYQEQLNAAKEKEIELSSAHGNYEKSSDYDVKISNEESTKAIKVEEKKKLEEQLQAGLKDGTIKQGTLEWVNMQTEIASVGNEIADCDTKIEELKQSQIGVYYEEQFDRAIDKIDQFKDRLDTLNGIISDDMKIDKNTGLLTEWGATSVMLNRNQFAANQKELKTLLDERKQIEADYKAGKFGEKTYDEKIKNVESSYNSLISSQSSLQNEMLSLIKNQAQAELDALNKVISKRKEALSAKKDYYDYDKTLKNKTKDIQVLERQIAALQGSTNAEDKARLAKIQEQLSDAREDLSDTITDHAYSMQSDALDKLSSDMSDDFDKWSNDISSNVEKMSKAINEAVSNSALSNAQVLNNLSTILKNVGLTDEQVNSTLSGLTGYASGTDYVPKSGMYRVNENGMESVLSRKYGTLTFLNQGDKVFTADFTKRLIDNAGIATQSSQPQFGEMYKELMNAITNTNNQSYEHSTVYNIIVNEATDANAVGDIVVKKIDAYEKKRVRDFKSLR